MTKIKNLYKKLGNTSRLIIKISILFSLIFSLLGAFANHAHFTPFHYELLLISDELIATSRAFLTIGFIGAFLFNHLEKKE